MTPRLSLGIVLGLAVLALAPNAQAQQPGVRAESGGIAVGNVSGSTITIGISPEQLEALIRQSAEHSETQKKLISELEGKLDLNQRQVRAALDVLGEKDIPPERLAAKLGEIAERFKVLQATALAQPGDDAKIAALKAEAQKAIEAGDLTKADALLAEVESDQQRMLDTLAVNAAETSARRGDIALARLRYGDAARHFANAAAVFPPGTHQDKRIDNLQKEADALYRQGDELGDNGALLLAIERRRQLLSLISRERAPLQWAMAQNNLGLALWNLGGRESGTVRLEEAVAVFREALKERTRERVPLDWARTQTNLGEALLSLGSRESGTAKLEEALVAFREALNELTRERVPLDWANTQFSLGGALLVVGGRESGTAKLEEAVATFREVLKEWTRERVPLDWASVQHNLGGALYSLGWLESGTSKLEEAVAAYREALKESTRERLPLSWATTQNNLGTALAALGERESGTARLDEAVAAFREALKEITRERMPLDWALSQAGLGWALTLLGERESGTAKLEEALAAYREALKEHTRERLPLRWAYAFGGEGEVLLLLAEHRGDPALAETAFHQINAACETLRNEGDETGTEIFEKQLPKARAIVARLHGR